MAGIVIVVLLEKNKLESRVLALEKNQKAMDKLVGTLASETEAKIEEVGESPRGIVASEMETLKNDLAVLHSLAEDTVSLEEYFFQRETNISERIAALEDLLQD